MVFLLVETNLSVQYLHGSDYPSTSVFILKSAILTPFEQMIVLPFFKGALLRYILHIIKFNHFKCMIQWFWIKLWSCAAITVISFRTSSLPSINSQSHRQSSQPQENTALLSVFIDLPILDILYKWNYITGGLSCLTSSTVLRFWRPIHVRHVLRNHYLFFLLYLPRISS